MKDIRHIALELVRSGPAHNQLLSPLTLYIALCGGDSPVNVSVPFEQRQLLMRIQRLRYELEANNPSPEQIEQRQAELRDLGELLGNFLGKIPTLLAQLSQARCDGGKMAHLRLSLCADELSMVPFETAIAPIGFPGTGSPLFLQSITPVTITREIRRNRPLPVNWNRPPKILFAFASPPDLPAVPAEQHLQALRDALRPWLRTKVDAEDRVNELKKLITVLPNASLQDIHDCCHKESFTHVHILAHGAPYDDTGKKRYGLALCRHTNKSHWDVVDGESLGISLAGKDATGTTKHIPTFVSLTACDSGTISSVISPGGSIAHQLHYTGIPWVVASQFPLWMKASVIVVRELYTGLLEGVDPRWVLYGLRQKLRTDCPKTHDWASIVAYSSLPEDFERQVSAFRERQTKAKVEVKLDRVEDLFCLDVPQKQVAYSDEQIEELEQIKNALRELLEQWHQDFISPDDQLFNGAVAMRLALRAACEKRIATAYQLITTSGKSGKDFPNEMLKAYRASREYYRKAVESDPTCTWMITQYLCMHAVIAKLRTKSQARRKTLSPFDIAPEDWWFIGIGLCQAEARSSFDKHRSDALTSLIELNLMGWFYDQAWDVAEAQNNIKAYVDELIRLEQPGSLRLIALRRQLHRYQNYWQHENWNDLVSQALECLELE